MRNHEFFCARKIPTLIRHRSDTHEVIASVTSAPSSLQSVDQKGNERIRFLLDRLGKIAALIVLLAALAVAASFYLLQAKPLAESDAQLRQAKAASAVIDTVENMVQRVERTLLMAKDWGRDGLIDLEDIAAFNRLLIPVLAQETIVSSIYLARDDGRMFYLVKSDELWKNRITDVPQQGQQQRWLHWEDANTLRLEEWMTQNYDPRARPWFQGAMQTAEDQIHWSDPYLFTIQPIPGITASVRWQDPASGQHYILSMDILLEDISRQTESLDYGTRGQVALLTADGKLLGLPRDPLLHDPVLRSGAVLSTPIELGLNLMAEALRLTQGTPGQMVLPAGLAEQTEDWQANLHPLQLQNQRFYILTLAPLSDFHPISAQLYVTLVVVMLSIAVIALLVVQMLVRAIRRPITAIYTEAEQTRQLAEAEMRRRADIANIALRLQSAQSVSALGQILLTELASRLALGQGVFCLWDTQLQQVTVVASYAGSGETAAENQQAVGDLVAQCAQHACPIVIDDLDADYFRIQSALGQMAPRHILLHPVRYRRTVLAVLELASLHSFDARDRQLLGELETLVAMGLDILLRADDAQAMLQKTTLAEERNRLILDAADNGIWGVNSKGRITFANRAALTIVGYEELEVIGRALHDVVHFQHPDGRKIYSRNLSPHNNVMHKTLEDGQSRQIKGDVLWRKDGAPVPVEYSTTAIKQGDHYQGGVMVFRDTSGQLAVERKLREQESQIRLILEKSPVAVRVADLATGRLLLANQAYMDLLNISDDKLEYTHVERFYQNPDDLQMIHERLLMGEEIRNRQLALKTTDDRALTVLAFYFPIEFAGEPCVLAWFMDLSGESQAIAGNSLSVDTETALEPTVRR